MKALSKTFKMMCHMRKFRQAPSRRRISVVILLLSGACTLHSYSALMDCTPHESHILQNNMNKIKFLIQYKLLIPTIYLAEIFILLIEDSVLAAEPDIAHHSITTSVNRAFLNSWGLEGGNEFGLNVNRGTDILTVKTWNLPKNNKCYHASGLIWMLSLSYTRSKPLVI